jgi:hypothetical protein
LKFLGITFFSFDCKSGKLSFGKFDKILCVLILCGSFYSIYETTKIPNMNENTFAVKYGWTFMLISNILIVILNGFYLLFKMKDCENFVNILFEFDEKVRDFDSAAVLIVLIYIRNSTYTMPHQLLFCTSFCGCLRNLKIAVSFVKIWVRSSAWDFFRLNNSMFCDFENRFKTFFS